jgi:hypothetical protein
MDNFPYLNRSRNSNHFFKHRFKSIDISEVGNNVTKHELNDSAKAKRIFDSVLEELMSPEARIATPMSSW